MIKMFCALKPSLHPQGYLAEGQRKNGQERGARSGEGGPEQFRQRLLHPVVAVVAGCEQEASPDVGCELDYQTNLRRTAAVWMECIENEDMFAADQKARKHGELLYPAASCSSRTRRQLSEG